MLEYVSWAHVVGVEQLRLATYIQNVIVVPLW